MKPLALLSRPLHIGDVVNVARRWRNVKLTPETCTEIEGSAAALQELIADGQPIYGLTTGAGVRDAITIPAAADVTTLTHQQMLLRSHAAGVGDPMPHDQVRAMILCRVASLCGGISAVSRQTVEALVALLNEGVTPVVPCRGSVGAGDLAPMAHAGLVLIGEGRAWFGDERLPGDEALSRAGLAPIALRGRDSLAIISGPAQSIGLGALAVSDASQLIVACETAAALTMSALHSPVADLSGPALDAKPGRGIRTSAERLLSLVTGSDEQGPSAEPSPDPTRGDVGTDPGRVSGEATKLNVTGRKKVAVDHGDDGNGPRPLSHDYLSTRTAHHIAGAARDAVSHAKAIVEGELNAALDNPMVSADGWMTNNAANLDGTRLAHALDLLANGIGSLAVASERRTARLLDPCHNGGLPPFLTSRDDTVGVRANLMLVQTTAASIVAEMRLHSGRAGMQSIPTGGSIEDYVSMSALAARETVWLIESAELIVAAELLVACQAVDVAGAVLSDKLRAVHGTIRERIPQAREDRVVGDDIEIVAALLRAGELHGMWSR